MSRIPLFWNYGKKFIHAYFQNILKDRDRFENCLSNGKMASTFIKKNEVFRTLKKTKDEKLNKKNLKNYL